jgi:hypothetical protein
MNRNRLLLLLTLCLAPHAYAAESDAQALSRLHTEIVEMIGVPSCNNVVYCRLLAIGSLPCGGPSEYLAYAGTRTGNTGLLETKAAELGFLEEELRKERKDAGACAVLPVPTLACINGRCALVSPAR